MATNLFGFEDTLKWKVEQFSADNYCLQTKRSALEDRLFPLVDISDKFNRQSVSFQLSKTDCLHRWLKYKEGFSSDLVSILLDEFNIQEGDTVMDPFLGSGTTALVCKMKGINSVGFDILPMSRVSIMAKSAAYRYSIAELESLLESISTIQVPNDYQGAFEYVSITEGAFPIETEKEICFTRDFINASNYSEIAKNLFTLCSINSLERVSYTAKNGQYLAWDYRSSKVINGNKKRIEKGKNPFATKLDKGELPSYLSVLKEELTAVISDIKFIQQNGRNTNADLNFIEESALFAMPTLESDTISGVITSPPYCNRYDYTRTYALELNYLGKTTSDINRLRQTLLTCTVENKSKREQLKQYYCNLGREDFYNNTVRAFDENDALNEIKEALLKREANGDINNKGVIGMVEGYFFDLTFIYAELFRLCKKGAHVAFVNDNVRYGGEVICVDFISCSLAESLGFVTDKIYTLKQMKGNSSQQMKKYGRVALRKSITIWHKP